MRSALFFAGILLIAIGCRTTPKPPPPPLTPSAAFLAVEHYVGAPLSGPVNRTIDANAARDALAVEVTFVALERMPIDALRPLGTQARLIAAVRGGAPVLPSARLTQTARAGAVDGASFLAELTGGKFGRAEVVPTLRGALPDDVTATFQVFDPRGTTPRRVELDVHRIGKSPAATQPGDVSVEIAMIVDDRWQPPVADDDAAGSRDGNEPGNEKSPPPTTPPLQLQREFAVLMPQPVAGGLTTAVIVPFGFNGLAAHALAAIITIAPASAADAGQSETLTKCLDDLRRANERLAKQPAFIPAIPPDWPGLKSALDALANPASARAAIVFLSDQTGARLCQDVALVADDPTLQQLSRRIQQATSAPNAPHDKTGIGWMLDRSAASMLSEVLNSDKLPPELSAVLLQHAGEPGRSTGGLDEPLKLASDRGDFENRLVIENYIYLEDSSPAARVRAFDWLRARNRAPSDFDPLGPAKERRAAIEKALNANASAPAATGSAP